MEKQDHVITLNSDGSITTSGDVVFGYLSNRNVHRIKVTRTDAWTDCTIRVHWYPPDGSEPSSTLVVNDYVTVPSSVTSVRGHGRAVFEGVVGNQVITSANLHYYVKTNCGIEDDTDIDPGSTSWQQFVDAVEDNAKAAAESAKESEAWAHGSEDYPETVEDNSKYWAEIAKQAAEQGGYLTFEIGEDGSLYLEQKNVSDLTFTLNDSGELEVSYGE